MKKPGPRSSDGESETLRGNPIDVLEDLWNSHQSWGAVQGVVSKLVERNALLERLIAESRASRNVGEHISADQLDIFLTQLANATPSAPTDLTDANAKLEEAAEEHAGRPERPKPPKQPPVRRPAPKGIRRVDNVIAVPDAERPCPVCGAERRCFTHETTEVIDFIPAEIIVRLDRREILACDACQGNVTRARMGDKVVPGGYYGSGLVAQMVVDRYEDGLPLHRIGERISRLGIDIPSASRSDQIQWATDLMYPLWRAAAAKVLGATVMHVDATSLPVRDEKTGHKVEWGALWGYVGDTEHAVYLFTSTGAKRGALPGEIGPEEFLHLRTGFVCADAANLFDKSILRNDLIEVGCNMHARRYFIKALDAGDVRAAPAIKAFRTIYDIEATAKVLDVDGRAHLRREKSRPVYDELLRWVETYRAAEPPSSRLGAALRYLHNHQVALTRFLDDGRLPIDNGIVERLHRTPAIARKAFLFAGSYAGARDARPPRTRSSAAARSPTSTPLYICVMCCRRSPAPNGCRRCSRRSRCCPQAGNCTPRRERHGAYERDRVRAVKRDRARRGGTIGRVGTSGPNRSASRTPCSLPLACFRRSLRSDFT